MKKNDPNQIILGELVDIEIINPDSEGRYHATKVSDIYEEDNSFSVNWPIYERRYLPARRNDKIKVILKRKDAIYYFESRIKARALEPYAHLRIENPKKLIKKQRRTYFRLPLNLIVKFIRLKDEVKEGELPPVYSGISLDLSGGGMSILSKTELELGENIEISFELTNGTRYEYVSCKVRRKKLIDIKYEYGLEFLDMPNRDREYIISYLFEVQRTRARAKDAKE
ncbi:c-di-GMP-binding flagellar brake protein YcgR [Hypnocyclicus thermotrophus]|uniref:C-di-GMP-binding flagellar brake protein YcgR n=1 Tax=Hypnocyclicus thermotrophus TaxID=1627895 RepID=A0AA46DYD0_9FUSO|nr:PilZ domain-containing protein [Hypnocyclicus thermotrophus]TDT69845.1 c-di-GMP-binding flagellar brake protein YcgR [Hypnocyclicus thermotrophus]